MSIGTLLILFVGGFCLWIGMLIGVWKAGRITVRKVLTSAAYLSLCVIIAGTLIFFLTKQTISHDEQRMAAIPHAKWGYTLEYYRFRHFTTLTIWYSSSMQLTYKWPSYFNPPTVKEAKWLANGKAVYLNLGFNFDDSAAYELPVKVIYDFEHGQMYATKYSARWLVNDREESRGDMSMTDGEFQSILSNLEK